MLEQAQFYHEDDADLEQSDDELEQLGELRGNGWPNPLQ